MYTNYIYSKKLLLNRLMIYEYVFQYKINNCVCLNFQMTHFYQCEQSFL